MAHVILVSAKVLLVLTLDFGLGLDNYVELILIWIVKILNRLDSTFVKTLANHRTCVDFCLTEQQTLSPIQNRLLTALREGDECAQTAVAQPPEYPHVSTLPPVLAPTVLKLPELCSILILQEE